MAPPTSGRNGEDKHWHDLLCAQHERGDRYRDFPGSPIGPVAPALGRGVSGAGGLHTIVFDGNMEQDVPEVSGSNTG